MKAFGMTKMQGFFISAGSVLIVLSAFLFIMPNFVHAQEAYSDGSYSGCTYNDCGLTFGADASVDLSVTVGGASAVCSVADAQVQVMTDATSGYTLTMADNDTDTNMENGSGGSIPTISGTGVSPIPLTADTWGYRVDSWNGFGAGPTTDAANTSIPGVDFAAIPSSAVTPDTIASTSVAADPYVTTYVQFGLCADTTPPLGTYSDSVVYTAVVN
jgi:hypothetical protein